MKHDLAKMTCLDVYLSSLSTEEYNKIKSKIGLNTIQLMPLKSWDVYSEYFHNVIHSARVEADVHQVLGFAEKFNWKNNIRNLFEDADYDALIITYAQQKIMWVNDGFSKMTGYSKKYALEKTPRFLQGEQTDEATKQKIRTNLKQHKVFHDVIYNYKKDKRLYKCDVKIIPLFGADESLHYLALEKEVG